MLMNEQKTETNDDSLRTFTKSASAGWGPLTSELVASIRRQMAELLEAPATESWLSAVVEEAAETRELYRDPTHGFLLLAHAETAGLYRAPHDHGTGWVVYAVQRGEIEMGTYARVHDAQGRVGLVKRDSTTLRAGQVQVYLPGDIHDTRSLESGLLYRLTSCDLKNANVTRYAQRNGVWTDGASS
jgi:hypothetical protein